MWGRQVVVLPGAPGSRCWAGCHASGQVWQGVSRAIISLLLINWETYAPVSFRAPRYPSVCRPRLPGCAIPQGLPLQACRAWLLQAMPMVWPGSPTGRAMALQGGLAVSCHN